jgi:hypothetical protein
MGHHQRAIPLIHHPLPSRTPSIGVIPASETILRAAFAGNANSNDIPMALGRRKI